MATRNLLVRAGFDASGMRSGVRQANTYLRDFGAQANRNMGRLSQTMSSTMGKIGKLMAGAFAIGTIVKFGKKCVDLGSDLQEVQNVVDVTFGKMAEEVNQFAKTAITQFGLSETSAKQYTSTMGSMLKSMGLTTNQALEMSKTITGLSADMASFYNLDSEDAFYKIRSGISGETEPLKELGINMSVANMQAYALSQGITKAYSKMSQAEQTLLRYNYLLSVTADAQGDFTRTSDGWANQVRILSEQFNALKAEIGQGLIVALTPVVKALNIVINKLRVAAGYFRSFMELIFGKQSSSSGSGMADVAESTESIADSASSASDAVEEVGDAAKKAGKKAQGALASFDELNVLAKANSGSDSDSGGSGGLENMGGSVNVDLGEIEEDPEKLSGLFDDIINQLQHMKDLFAEGFKFGISTADFEALKSTTQSVKDGFMAVFEDGTILNAFTNMLNSMSFNLGKVIGSSVSIGTSIATNLIGGFGAYLEQNQQYIKDRLIGIFNVSTEISNLVGSFAVAFADIFSVFGGETAQQITANIIGMFANGFLGATELALKSGSDILDCITGPIIENKDKIKEALENTLKPIETITGVLKDLVTNTLKSVLEAYDQYIAPAYQNIKEGLTQIVSTLLDAYNTHIAPTIDKIANAWREFYEQHLQPVIDKAIDVLGKLVLAVSELFESCLAPFVAWCMDYMAPFISAAFEAISEAFRIVAEFITDTVSGLLDIFGGLIDYLRGIFKGDWELVWSGIKQFYIGICDTFQAIFINPLKNGLDWLLNTFTKSWENAWEGCKKIFKGVFDSLVAIAKVPINLIIDAINTMIRGINKFKIDIPDWVGNIPGLGGIGGKSIGFDIPTIPKLAKGGVLTQSTIVEAGEYAGARSNPEIVTPQDIMYDTVVSANAELASSLFQAAKMIVTAIENKDTNVMIGDEAIGRSSISYINKQTKLKGMSPLTL